jgi:nucleoside-diphosphate-sugar epimerase
MVLSNVLIVGAHGPIGKNLERMLNKDHLIWHASRKKLHMKDFKIDLDSHLSHELFFKQIYKIDFRTIIFSANNFYSSNHIKELHQLYTLGKFVESITSYCNYMGSKLIYVSGAIVYKDIYKNLIDERDKKGLNQLGGMYGLSKITAENILEKNFTNKKMLVILRPTSLFSYRYGMSTIIDDFIYQVLTTKRIKLTEPVHDSFNFISVEKLSEYIAWFIKYNGYGIFNLGSTENTSLMEIAKNLMDSVSNSSLEIVNEDPRRESRHVYRLNLGKVFQETEVECEKKIIFTDILKRRGVSVAKT